MGIFGKKANSVAINAADYTLELINSAINEYRKQEPIIRLLQEEASNDTMGYYERQYLAIVQKRVIEAINAAKGVFGEEFSEINMICKELEDDVAQISFDLYKKGIIKKLKQMGTFIKDVRKEF